MGQNEDLSAQLLTSYPPFLDLHIIIFNRLNLWKMNFLKLIISISFFNFAFQEIVGKE